MLKRTTVSVSRERTARIAGGGSGPTVTFIDTQNKHLVTYRGTYPLFGGLKNLTVAPAGMKKCLWRVFTRCSEEI